MLFQKNIKSYLANLAYLEKITYVGTHMYIEAKKRIIWIQTQYCHRMQIHTGLVDADVANETVLKPHDFILVIVGTIVSTA